MTTVAAFAALVGVAVNSPSRPSHPIEIPNATREDFAGWLATLGARRIVEVGVECGRFTEVLAESNPDAEIIGLDAWTAYRGYREHVTQAKVDMLAAEATSRLMRFGSRVRLVRAWASPDGPTHAEIAPGSVDVIYLDANHALPHVIADLATWAPMVRPGGLIAGHDYGRRKNSRAYPCHVVEAVSAWTQAYQIAPWFIVGRKHAAPNERRDDVRSWCWVA